MGFAEGDLMEVTHAARPGRARLRISGIRAGRAVPAVPLRLLGHPGRRDGPDGHGRAANELTLTDWDPVSKQPIFKTAAAQVQLLERGGGRLRSPAPTTTASRPVAAVVPPTAGGESALATESAGAR